MAHRESSITAAMHRCLSCLRIQPSEHESTDSTLRISEAVQWPNNYNSVRQYFCETVQDNLGLWRGTLFCEAGWGRTCGDRKMKCGVGHAEDLEDGASGPLISTHVVQIFSRIKQGHSEWYKVAPSGATKSGSPPITSISLRPQKRPSKKKNVLQAFPCHRYRCRRR